MILKILGSGTSTGVPLPGCRCAVCTSPDPRNKRLRTAAALLFDTGNTVLIDASTDLRAQALAYGIDRVDTVLFTHAHADHILGIDDLRAFNFVQRMPIPCFATERTWELIRRTFWYIFEVDPQSHKSSVPALTTHRIEPFTTLTLFDEPITPIPVEHGGMEVLGFRIRDLAYVTDCNHISPESMAALQGLDTLVIDGLRFEPHPTHFTIDESLAIIAALKPKQSFITHIGHTVDHASHSTKLPPSVSFAYDGLELPIR